METNTRNIDYGRRVVPWNGLGTDISGCSTVGEALFTAGLNWKVRQTPVQTAEIFPVPLEGFRANVRDYDDAPLGIVTDRYKVVQNDEAFSFVDSLVDDGVQFQQAGIFGNGRRVWILAKLPDRYIISGEAVSPFVVFITSHDGSGSVKVAMTPVRVICCNMLNLALRNASRTWSAQHTGDISKKLEDARDTLFHAEIYMNELGKEIEVLNHTRISDATVFSMVNELMPVSDDMTDAQKKNIGLQRDDLFERYFHAPDLELLPRNAFRFIQAVSDHATHADPIKQRANFRENLFAKSVDGNPLIDRAYSLLKAA